MGGTCGRCRCTRWSHELLGQHALRMRTFRLALDARDEDARAGQ
jgi:hypothetical protein